ncbi:catalase family peroxidase [Roseateles sp.]|uniref:catalase family peroxidase n=1 Tax=Roseateles sp. TaxID=1971397 RepID=UPI0039E9ED03
MAGRTIQRQGAHQDTDLVSSRTRSGMQNSQHRSAGRIVDLIHGVLGLHEGYRTLHADGRLYRGVFQANEEARRFSRAIHLNGDVVPATVRFSKGGGDPFAHFSATVGMATRFYLPDGDITNLVMLSQKLFVARSIEEFIELVTVAQPTAPGAGPNLPALQAFLKTNPRVANVFRMRAESAAPVSFAHTAFHAIHAFRFINAEDKVTHLRVHWEPVGGVLGQFASELAQASPSVLFDELDARLAEAPIAFNLVVELAEPGDPLDDPTTLWPAGRKLVTIGRLEVRAPTTEQEIGDRVMNHDPSKLTDGIEATDDPILQIRRGVYEVSAAQRTGGWRACPFGAGQTSPSNGHCE